MNRNDKGGPPMQPSFFCFKCNSKLKDTSKNHCCFVGTGPTRGINHILRRLNVERLMFKRSTVIFRKKTGVHFRQRGNACSTWKLRWKNAAKKESTVEPAQTWDVPEVPKKKPEN